MPNRILKESICTSDTLASLPPEAEVLFYRLIVQCDDYGRLDANPAIVRAKCFPLRTDDIKCQQIVEWLQTLHNARIIIIYEVDKKKYLQMVTWGKHQRIRANKSKYPAPPEAKRRTSADIGGRLLTNAPVIGNVSESVSESVSGNDNDNDPPVVPPDNELSLLSSEKTGEEREKTVYEIYREEKFGEVTPVVTAALEDAVEKFGEDTVVEAMRESSLHGHANLAYLQGVLKNWESGNKKPGGNGRNRDPDKYRKGKYGHMVQH